MSHLPQWRHNGCDGVPNHQPHDCLFNRLFRRRSKKTSTLRVTGLCAGNSPVTGEFPAQMPSKRGKCFHLMTSSWIFSQVFTKAHYIARPLGNIYHIGPHYITALDYKSCLNRTTYCWPFVTLFIWNKIKMCLLSYLKTCFRKCHLRPFCCGLNVTPCFLQLLCYTLPYTETSTDWKKREKKNVVRRYFIKWKIYLLRSVVGSVFCCCCCCKLARCP